MTLPWPRCIVGMQVFAALSALLHRLCVSRQEARGRSVGAISAARPTDHVGPAGKQGGQPLRPVGVTSMQDAETGLLGARADALAWSLGRARRNCATSPTPTIQIQASRCWDVVRGRYPWPLPAAQTPTFWRPLKTKFAASCTSASVSLLQCTIFCWSRVVLCHASRCRL
jgi:hypothetical protein